MPDPHLGNASRKTHTALACPLPPLQCEMMGPGGLAPPHETDPICTPTLSPTSVQEKKRGGVASGHQDTCTLTRMVPLVLLACHLTHTMHATWHDRWKPTLRKRVDAFDDGRRPA